MRDLSTFAATRWTCAAVAAVGLALAAAPAAAQSTVEELTVVAKMGPDGRPESLSRPVSYADLDLTTSSGVSELQSRVRQTARDLCRELGEPDPARSPSIPSCERNAVNDAREQVDAAVSSAKARAAAPPMPAAPETGTAAPASVTTTIVTNGPIPDTPENRQRYGSPLSNAGKRTAAKGN